VQTGLSSAPLGWAPPASRERARPWKLTRGKTNKRPSPVRQRAAAFRIEGGSESLRDIVRRLKTVVLPKGKNIAMPTSHDFLKVFQVAGVSPFRAVNFFRHCGNDLESGTLQQCRFFARIIAELDRPQMDHFKTTTR